MASTNSTSGLQLPQVHIAIQAIEVCSLVLLIVFGLLGNLCVCFVVLKTRDLWTIPNLLILNLSVSDLLRILCSLSVSCVVLITRKWIWDETFCQISGFYTLVFLSISLLCVTLISVNRYFLIVKPNKNLQVFSRRNTKFMVVCVWCVGFLTAFPPLLGIGRYDFIAARATCFIAHGSANSYTSILVIILIGVPCSVTIWCYIQVYLTMRASKERVVVNVIPHAVPSNQSRRKLSPREIKVASTMLLLVGVYLITWIPVSVVHFLRVAGIRDISSHVDLGAALLMSWSCVTNPWIYGFKNTYFRDQLRKMLCMKTAVRQIDRECDNVDNHN